jgi:(p)ppGpp synthase/HD superfamily hydrolase
MTPTSSIPRALTPRFEEAVSYAVEIHAGQTRKGSSVPYVSHPMAVCSLVLEDGGSEDEAIAALLHDAVEDGGGPPVLAEIRRRFGEKVAGIVADCTDTDREPKPPWLERKTRHVAHIRQAGPASRRVACADKLHNARSILFDYNVVGEELWSRFTGTREQVLWYLRSLVEVFRETGTGPMSDELARVVSEIERRAGSSGSAGR